MLSLYVTMLDGPRSNMVTFLCIWLVSFLTMLGDSFLTWLDYCYCVRIMSYSDVFLFLTMLGESLLTWLVINYP